MTNFLKRRTAPTVLPVLALALAGCSIGSSSSPKSSPTPYLHATGQKTLTVVSTNIPRTLSRVKHPRVLHIILKVTGVALDVQDMGKPPRDSQGHIQAYLDSIPANDYKAANLKPPWMFTVASSQVNFRMPTLIQQAKPGPHRILLALAKNNDVLYAGAKPASVSFTLK